MREQIKRLRRFSFFQQRVIALLHAVHIAPAVLLGESENIHAKFSIAVTDNVIKKL